MNAAPRDPEHGAASARSDAAGKANRSGGPARVDIDGLLRRAADMVDAAPGIPMSASVRVNRDELLDLLDEAIDALPEELRAARLAPQGTR